MPAVQLKPPPSEATLRANADRFHEPPKRPAAPKYTPSPCTSSRASYEHADRSSRPNPKKWVPRPIAYLMGLSGLIYLVQGWVVGSDGFSGTHDTLIVVTEVVSLAWMIWLVVFAWRTTETKTSRTAPGLVGGS
jgi:hypothetical protein